MKNTPLNQLEEDMWEAVSMAIWKEKDGDDCHSFYSTIQLATAICCSVVVEFDGFGSITYGLCTMMDFLIVPTPGQMYHTTRWFTSLDSVDPATTSTLIGVYGVSSATSGTTTTTTTTAVSTPAPTVYINLFEVQCKPMVNDFLCSRYCCADSNNDGDFGNSQVDCY